jgi:hypothetical protein
MPWPRMQVHDPLKYAEGSTPSTRRSTGSVRQADPVGLDSDGFRSGNRLKSRASEFRNRHLVVRLSPQFSPGSVLLHATPLFEEKRGTTLPTCP